MAASLTLPLASRASNSAGNNPAVSSAPKTNTPHLAGTAADSISLDEIVVTGQAGAIQRRRLSSTITKVGEQELQKLPAGRIDQMLQNALPNVQFTLSNGQPGTTSTIKSRGLSSAFTNSTPIIYVDGVRIDNLNTGSYLNYSKKGYGSNPYTIGDMPMGEMAATGTLADIPLENIDHIEYVSGGAATTIYGSDAANGVIQLFTKKGTQGGFRASFSTELGVDVANSQYYHFKRTKELLHQTGFEQRYRLSIDVGNQKYGYSLGASMSQNTGTVIHNVNENKKYDLRFGSHINFNDKLEYQNSFGFVAQDFHRSRNGNQGFYTGLWFAEGAAATNFKYKAQDGTLQNYTADIDAIDDYAFGQMKNFVSRAEALQNYRETVKRFQTSQTLLFKPLTNLTFKGTFGIDYRDNRNKEIVTNEYLIHTQVKPQGTTDAGRINNFNRNYFGLTADLNGQYKLYSNRWSNILTAGFQYFNTHDMQIVANGANVRDGAKVMSGAASQQADEWLSNVHNYGFYMQDNVGLFNRYYLDLGMRIDNNTAFGENVRWQFYPKVGLSYVMSDEAFLKSMVVNGTINTLRLFCNYGVAGSYPPAFEYQKTIDISSFQGKQAATFGKYGNPDLGPERKHSFELGLESSLFNHLLTIGFNYYYTHTRNAIFSIPTLPSSGQNSNYLANIGDIRNKGVELNMALTPVRTHDWTLTLQSSFNTNHNKVLSTGGTLPFAIGGFGPSTIQTVVQEGKPVGFLRGNQAVLNADNTLKEVLSLQDLGSTLPTFYGNFAIDLRYKMWQLWVSGDYQTGAYVHSFDRQFRFLKGLKDKAIPEAALRGISQKESWLSFTNYFVEKADFLKIRNIGLNYTHPFASKTAHIKSILVGFNIYNPLSFTASSVDPEASLAGAQFQGAVATGGLNYSTYSLPRQYVVSLKINL